MATDNTPSATRDRLTALIRPGRVMLGWGAVLSVLSSLLWLAQAWLIADSLGALLSGREVAAAARAAALFGLFALRAGLSLAGDRLAQQAADEVVHQARLRRLAAVAARGAGSGGVGTGTGTGTGTGAGAGAAAALAGETLDLLGPWVSRYRPAQARVWVLPLVIAGLALSQSWAAALILLITGPLIPVFMALIGLAAREASARQLREVASLNDLLVERLSALVDIRLLGARGAVLTGFVDRSAALRRRSMAVLRIAFLSSTVLELFAAIGVAMMAVYVGFSLLGLIDFGHWGRGLDPAAGVFLLLMTPEFFQPLRDLAAAWHDKAAAEAVADQLAEADRAAPADALIGQGGQAAPLPGAARLRLAATPLPDGRLLPRLDIRAGEAVALIGPSGAGKTTLLRRMAGLAGPEGGVEVAGQPLDAARADGWRARIGWMPQAPQFLPASLRANVTMGRAGAGDDLSQALARAAFAPVLRRLPRGLDTRLGPTGAGLSGGEARRLMLARALFGRPDVILADEPTADLDPATAAQVRAALRAEAARGATVIVATHDPDLAAAMGRIVDLSGGS